MVVTIFEIQLVKDNKDALFDYAKREADWLLPKLMNKQKLTENSNADIEHHLLEMLDRELDDHEVCAKNISRSSWYIFQ